MNSSSYYSPKDTLTHEAISPKMEAELFREYYAGDTTARDMILENNLRYAASVAQRHCNRRDMLPDIISAANAGLMKALEMKTFDPERGRFTTYATKFILGEIRATFRVSGAVSFPAGCLPEWNEDGPDPDPSDFADPNSFNPSDIDHELLATALQSLDPKERRVIEMIYFEDASVVKAAQEVDICRAWAGELRDRALDKLRIALGAAALVTVEEPLLKEVA